MIIKARIAGVFADTPIFAEGEVELKENADLKTFFKRADKSLGLETQKYFRLVLRMPVQPTVLLNGDRLDLPEGFKHLLRDGDEIMVLSPIAGG
jgi:molybdopterin converting factor small subunit